jgi:phosphohistidine swiveling domain-containing protein
MNEKEAAARVKKTVWRKTWSRRMTVRNAENWLESVRTFGKIFFEARFPDQLIFIVDGVGHGYHNEAQLIAWQKEMLKDLLSSSFHEFYEKRGLPVLHGFKEYCKRIAETNLEKKSLSELRALHEEYTLKADEFTNVLWIIFLTDDFFTEELGKRLKKHVEKNGLKQDWKQLQETIVSPEEKTAVFQQTIDLLEAAKRVRAGSERDEASELARKYAFFPVLNLDEEPLGREYFQKELDKVLNNPEIDLQNEINRINERFEQSGKNYLKARELLKNDEQLLILAEACHKISFHRDYRNDVRRESAFHARKLYQEIAKRLQVGFSELLFMNREEISESLEKGRIAVAQSGLESRRKCCALASIDGETCFILDQKTAEELFELIEPRLRIREFKGIAASPGRVEGRAKIILNIQKDAPKLKTGDVLVTSMTNLDFLPLLAKAAAVITDEGGLLCHASIVSRELKKPCITGTRIATKVLKDGDWVEVHANHGLVKVIKQAE